MDIDLLSKMLKELLRDEDTVCLPGLGTFYAEIVPAAFSDRGYTINPPYRRLSFRQRREADTKLTELYAASNGVDGATAQRIVSEFLEGLRQILQERKAIIFSGLGKLRATKENNFFFVPDEDLDIYPDGFGLEPVSLKTHEETPEELSAAVSGLAAMMAGQGEARGEAVAETAGDITAETEAESWQSADTRNEDVDTVTNEAETEPRSGEEIEAGNEPEAEAGAELSAVPQSETETADISETVTVAETGSTDEAEQKPVKVEAGAELSNSPQTEMDATGASKAEAGSASAATEVEVTGTTEAATEVDVGAAKTANCDATAGTEPESESEAISAPAVESEAAQNTAGAEAAGASEAATVVEAGAAGRKAKHKGKVARTVALVLLILIAAALVLLGVFLLLAWLAPDFIDSLLYSSEELWVIRY